MVYCYLVLAAHSLNRLFKEFVFMFVVVILMIFFYVKNRMEISRKKRRKQNFISKIKFKWLISNESLVYIINIYLIIVLYKFCINNLKFCEKRERKRGFQDLKEDYLLYMINNLFENSFKFLYKNFKNRKLIISINTFIKVLHANYLIFIYYWR